MNVPVVCGGQVVMPGDILVGDRDGIVVIPRQEAAELLEAARKNLQDCLLYTSFGWYDTTDCLN